MSEEQPDMAEQPGDSPAEESTPVTGGEPVTASEVEPATHDAEPVAHDAPALLDPRRARRPGLPVRRASAEADAIDQELEPGDVDAATLAMAHRIVDLAAAKKASDIVLLDVRGQTTMTDYFIICSGASDRQLGAIADGIGEGMRDEGVAVLSREGDASSHWILLDFGGAIVHVMSVPEREFYQLERLWAKAALLVHIV